MGGSTDEFPLLSGLGLYAADIRGDGNCLFNALSDQLYGHQNDHHIIRSKVIDYMREHADYYKMFIDVHPGGGTRRNPKRKNVAAYSAPVNVASPTEADIDRVFQSHLQSMAKGGTYGDNMEISAFSSAFAVDVKIYQRDFAYVISGAGPDGQGVKRPMAHIAYHVWEHYSSIRNLDGPHNGLPDVQERALSVEEEKKQKEKLAHTPHVQPWMIDVVAASLPFLTDKPLIKKTLEDYKGDINAAVDKLLGDENNGHSSTQESSSVEREPDSDEEYQRGPSKKQDRRMSARQRSKKSESSHALSKLATHNDSQSSFTSEQSIKTDPDAKPVKAEPRGDTPSDALPKPTIRIKLKPPAPPSTTSNSSSGKTQQKQQGPQRQTAREKKDMKKLAQKAARKERQQAAIDAGTSETVNVPLRTKGITNPPPIESGLKTLYI